MIGFRDWWHRDTPDVWVAEPHEAETVARLMVAFRNHLGRSWPSDNAFLAGIEGLIELPDTEFLLASPSDDSPPEGVCQLRFRYSIWTESDDCWLEDIFVEEAARGSGLGRALMEAAFDRARERGCARMELDVNEANPAAVGLYESLGFEGWSDPPGGRNLLMRRRL